MSRIYDRLTKKIREQVITELYNKMSDDYQKRAFVARLNTNSYDQGQLSGLRIAMDLIMQEKKGK